MRQIEFRVMTNDGKWSYGFLYTNYNQNNIIVDGDLFEDSTVNEVKKETVGQYTGKRDKNGVKIYTGDIISNEFGRKCEVVFNTFIGAFDCVAINSKGYSFNFEFKDWEFTEVIGNIHEGKND